MLSVSPIKPQSFTLLASICWWILAVVGAAQGAESIGYAPDPVGDADFRHLNENSPFTRPLNLSESLVLTGVASIDGKPMAILMDKKSKEIHFLSEEPNPDGWRIVEIKPNADPQKVVAKISVAGSTIAEVRYEQSAMSPAFKPIEYKYDNQGRAIPSQHLIDKFRKMNREQMGRYQAWRAQMVKKDPDLDKSPRRFPIIEKAMDAILSGRQPVKP